MSALIEKHRPCGSDKGLPDATCHGIARRAKKEDAEFAEKGCKIYRPSLRAPSRAVGVAISGIAGSVKEVKATSRSFGT
jgi:hypothetical protein